MATRAALGNGSGITTGRFRCVTRNIACGAGASLTVSATGLAGRVRPTLRAARAVGTVGAGMKCDAILVAGSAGSSSMRSHGGAPDLRLRLHDRALSACGVDPVGVGAGGLAVGVKGPKNALQH